MPRNALSIFDEAITFLRIEPGLLLGVAVTVLLPLRLIAVAVPGSPLRDARPDELLDIFVGNLEAPGAVLAAIITVVLESIALFTVASIYGHVSSVWYSGQAVTAADLLVTSIRRSPLLLLAWGLIHVAEVVAALFSVGLGAIFVGILFIVAAPVMGAEGAGPIAALRRSASIAAPRFVHVFFVFALTGLGAITMRLMLEAAPSLFGLEVLGLPLWLIAGVADVVATVITTAFVAAAATVLYLDLRVRREGIDLSLAMSRAFDGLERPEVP